MEKNKNKKETEIKKKKETEIDTHTFIKYSLKKIAKNTHLVTVCHDQVPHSGALLRELTYQPASHGFNVIRVSRGKKHIFAHKLG